MSEEEAPAQNNEQTKSAKRYKITLLILVVILIVLLITGAWVIYDHHRKKPLAIRNTGTPAPAKVTITQDGFTPKAIQVQPGQEVIWINQDKTTHQVAADPYPKDNGISGFDSTVILNSRDTFEFAFDKTGTYTYHDERNPFKFYGTVVVAKPAS